MSHSSLSAQLASLHTKNTTSSRQQADAVGRGIHHNASSGHTILNGSTKHKPSVIHADSRAAAIADVPFSTLRENAVVSLQYLSQHSSPLFELSGENLPWQTLFGSKSIKHERGLNTSETNAKFDGMVKEALYLLSTAWGDAASTIAASSNTLLQIGTNIPASVLHSLEYLVQKYYVHVYNAENLLVAFLPHHETFLFDRLLQLIDLAQLPQWAFLRPYSTAIGANGIPRTAIAKWAASTKDNGGGTVLVKRVCELAKRGARIHGLERNLISLDEINQVRRGTSLFISFAAAILAETLHLQYCSIGSIDESTLRCLVPFILGAVEPNNSKKKKWSLGALCPEWRVFGQIMVSLLVDKCDLSPELCEAFSTGILKGAVESIKLLRSEINENAGDEDEDLDSGANQVILDLSADAMLAVMSLVLNNKSVEEEKSGNDSMCHLPTVKSKGNEVIGCNLPYSSFLALMKFPSLPATLGYLSEEKNIDLQHLLGSAIAMTISLCKSTSSNGRDCERFIEVLSALLVEPSLKHVWEGDSGCLSASMAALIVGHAEDMNGAAYLQHFAKILASLRDLNSANCDAGVAYAVTNASSISDDNAKETSVKSIRALLSAAGIYDQGQLEANKKRSNKDRSGAINDFDLMLPPRVALEHPNAQLRLDAIAKLTTEAKDNDDSDDIAVALLRRYCSDDNLSVVSASVNALVEMGVDGSLSELFLLQNDTVNDVINGFKRALKAAGISAKWENNERISIGDDESRMVCSALKLSGMVAKILKDNLDFELVDLEDDHTSENIYDNYERLVQGIVNIQYHCETDEDINFSAIENDAADALDSALNAGTKKAKSKATLMKDIVKGAAFQKVLQRSICSLTSDENVGVLETERLVWFFLHHTDSIPGKDCDADLIEYIIDACLLILERYEKETEKTEEFTSNATILTSNLAKCVSFLLSGGNVHEISKLVSDLSTIRSKVAYEEVGVKILETMSKSNPDLYPYLLFEILSRPNLAIIGIKRTLAAVDSFITTLGREDRNSVCRGLLVCAIALCCNSNLAVRETALDMIAKMAKMLGDNDAVATAFACICSTGCAPQSSMRSNMMMDGSSALPKMLSAAVQEGEDDSILRTLLLETCADLVNKMLHDNTNFAGEGICHSVVILLNAMEFAGEKSFSLNDRWHLAGKPIFDHFLAFPPSQSSASLQSLIECMLVMLKGITVEGDAAEDSIVISTGPAVSGRRRRAYSVGTSHGIAFIDPYPDEMQNTLTLFLSLAVKKPDDPFVLQLCEAVNRLVLSRSSWAKGIFTKLDNKTRDMITKSLLALRSDGGIESAGLALLGLPLTAEQFAEAISSKSSRASKADSGGLLALTALMDCIRAQAKSLESGKGVMKLLSVLYGKLSSLSNEDFAHDGSDYARTCVINALLALSENANDATQITKKTSGNKLPKEIGSQSKLLVSLLGEGGGGVKPLVSSRSRSLCLQLLTRLCALSPTSVVDSLIPAMINAISIDGARSSVTRDALVAIVPAYCTHAPSAGFSLLTLLHAFVKKCEEDSVSFEKKVQLYSYLNDALMSSSDNGSAGEVTSTVVTTYIASEAAPNHRIVVDDDNSPLSFVQELLSNIDANIQIAATLQILQYVGKLLPYLQNNGNHAMEDNSSFFILEIADICNLATNGPLKPESLKVKMPYQQKEKLPIMWCVTTLLSVVKQIYATGVVKRVIRDGDDSQARICLNIWQELMTLQSASTHARYEEASEGKTHSASDKFWESLGDETSGILSSLQNLLPAPHFLASVSSLISDNDVEVDIQRRALLLLAERCIETDPTSHEAVLFLEMLPDLVNLTGAKAKKADDFDFDSYRHSSILSQSSFKAIDQLSKSLGITVLDEKLRRKRTKAFMPALQATASYLHRIASNFEIPDFNNLNEANISAFNLETQVMSSAALCAASLITLLKAKCLTMLPKLVKPLIKLLTVANAHVTECNNKEIVNDSTGQSVKLIQLSALRALVAVADHIPQFLTPYIAGLMTVNGLPSQCLRGTESEEEIAVNNMADRLDRSIASGAAARQLIPILSKATSICLKSSSQGERIWKESLVIFKILKLSIEKATRSDLGPMAGKIISSLVQAYAFDCDIPTRIELINVANDTLLAMVMKLSEAQLRPLYTKLREWRGDLDTSQADGAAARRRNAFWSLSAAMSKELRSIFLPCMSTVVGDIVKELEFAVSCLCITKSSKGNKRQKLSETKSNVSDLTRPLQSLLLCIESSLNADAHEGGNWIRGDDGQRYTSILQPLMKLLSATVPQDCNILPMTVESNRPSSAYERLVQGVTTEDHGNISSCITSLAAAAGNEQMWKPLNHSLLEACADEKRPEVRKSGVKTLLSIIHALGEEYMVLLPECLPVLSELLEDEDEDIVALSKECVQQGEELLGESLEDNLR